MNKQYYSVLTSCGYRYVVYYEEDTNMKILCFFLRSYIGQYEMVETDSLDMSPHTHVSVYKVGAGIEGELKIWRL